MGHQGEVDNIENESKNKPWQSASSFSPEPGENTALEKFLFQIYRYLFDPKRPKVCYNSYKNRLGGIDPVAKEGGPLIPGDWKRYRDDTWDIEENANEKDLVQFTEYINAKVLKDKIKFTLEHSETELVFLDTKVHLKNGFLIPEIYSKPTDLHEYLNPKSSHPPNVVKNIPYSVALRVRRNGSDRIDDDTLFKKNMKKSISFEFRV